MNLKNEKPIMKMMGFCVYSFCIVLSSLRRRESSVHSRIIPRGVSPRMQRVLCLVLRICHTRYTMSAQKAYRRNSHSVYLCDYHLVFTTKYRHPVITPELWNYLHLKLLEITEHYPSLYIHEANNDKDHIHLLISIPPQMSVGDVVTPREDQHRA